jgi:hypothetical protein
MSLLRWLPWKEHSISSSTMAERLRRSILVVGLQVLVSDEYRLAHVSDSSSLPT